MKLIYQVVLLISIICIATNLSAQRENRSMPWSIWMHPTTNNFEEIRAEANDWFENRDRGRGTGYKQWKRWEENNQYRLNKNGKIFNQSATLAKEYKKARKYQKKNGRSATIRNSEGDWKSWSATEYTDEGSWGPGIGRINTIAFHPTDPNTIFIGAPAGGICKTTNNGDTWQCFAEDLASIGVSGIAINPSDPDIIYILTGDGDGGSGSRSIGVYKSTNGGVDWSATGLTWGANEDVDAYKLMMEPGDPNYLIVAADNGIWRTTNAGVTWSQRLVGSFTDIEYKPGTNNQNTVYATSTAGLWKSTDWGGSWTEKLFLSNANRIQIAVTPDENDAVYLLAGPVNTFGQAGFQGVYKSTDSGETFQLQSNSPNILGGNLFGTGTGDQSSYDLCIAVSPTESSKVITGGVNLWKSTNDGNSFSLTAHWNQEHIENNNLTTAYVHADHHYLIYNPLNDRLYNANDGGIYYSDDDGTTWTDITSGLDISMIYHFDGTNQDLNLMLAGMQDNGTSLMEKDTMRVVLGADGGDCLLHPTNDNIMYAMWQNGTVRKSIDKGVTWTDISPTGLQNGPFITPWAMDKNNPDIIYMGWSQGDLYYTTNGGDSWNFRSLTINNIDINSVSVADNSTTIYASSRFNIFKSTDSGNSWTAIFNDPDSQDFTSVTAIPGSPNECIITRGGFDSDNKVWKHTDANGAIPLIVHSSLFGNLNDTLPAVPVRRVAIPTNNTSRMYIGTEIGVYYNGNINSQSSKWEFFKKNLPNTPVRDIEIYEDQGFLRVGTFGRGIWQSDVWDDCEYDLVLTPENDPSGGNPGVQFNEAADQITSTRLIQGSNGDVTYKAGDLILLKNGFRATTGNKVIIGIKPCTISLD